MLTKSHTGKISLESRLKLAKNQTITKVHHTTYTRTKSFIPDVSD